MRKFGHRTRYRRGLGKEMRDFDWRREVMGRGINKRGPR